MPTITPADVKPHLNMGASTVNNADIEALIPGVEAMVAQRVGPLTSTATTEVVRGSGSCQLAVPVYPVVSVSSVTGKSGSTVTVLANVGWDAGVLWSDSAFTEDYYTVVYQAGRTSVPADLELALCKFVAADWLDTKPGREPDGRAVQLRAQAERLLAPFVLPGFA